MQELTDFMKLVSAEKVKTQAIKEEKEKRLDGVNKIALEKRGN